MTLDLFSAAGAEGAGQDARVPAPRPPRPQRGAAPEHPLSPTAVNALAREVLEGTLPPLWVAGEVTGWKRHAASGHCYFALRDARAQLRCVMFESDARRVPADPDEGMRVRVFGVPTLFERRGEFQLRVQRLEDEGGDGLWRLAFDRLKSRLAGEGLLAPERKRRLPRMPATVGIVTSPVGAALHDIVQVLRARAPWTRVLFSPARVQGPGAAQDVARALDLLARCAEVDVVIVGRGGGSVEDLWAFNEEPVARAIAACPVPVESAVGHEVDITIADLVADARAPTPSAAAEMVVPDGAALERELASAETRLRGALRAHAATRRRALERRGERLVGCMRERQRRREDRLQALAGTLDALSPLAALARGFAVPQAADGRLLRRATDFRPGQRFRLRVTDGRVDCLTEGVEAPERADGPASPERGGTGG
ncbi:MAG TPA: exodeoxyribonuclease VII large subunit [Longimicrobiales bacterium]|nr:exodeoxyribonuclease VII large subunit [Longimicrobiales bacterium]